MAAPKKLSLHRLTAFWFFSTGGDSVSDAASEFLEQAVDRLELAHENGPPH